MTILIPKFTYGYKNNFICDGFELEILRTKPYCYMQFHDIKGTLYKEGSLLISESLSPSEIKMNLRNYRIYTGLWAQNEKILNFNANLGYDVFKQYALFQAMIEQATSQERLKGLKPRLEFLINDKEQRLIE